MVRREERSKSHQWSFIKVVEAGAVSPNEFYITTLSHRRECAPYVCRRHADILDPLYFHYPCAGYVVAVIGDLSPLPMLWTRQFSIAHLMIWLTEVETLWRDYGSASTLAHLLSFLPLHPEIIFFFGVWWEVLAPGGCLNPRSFHPIWLVSLSFLSHSCLYYYLFVPLLTFFLTRKEQNDIKKKKEWWWCCYPGSPLGHIAMACTDDMTLPLLHHFHFHSTLFPIAKCLKFSHNIYTLSTKLFVSPVKVQKSRSLQRMRMC